MNTDISQPSSAIPFLESLLSKTLRITTTDTRIFLGELKCTDRDQNLILSQTYEYRLPKPTAENASKKLDMTSRFMGLVVVMGKDIIKIEVEEGSAGGGRGGVGRGGWGPA